METGDSSRKRTKIACEECRKHKRKCDGQRPICSLCEKGRRTCDYTSEPNGRKRKRFGLDYIRELEDQVETLTALLNGTGDTLGKPAASEPLYRSESQVANWNTFDEDQASRSHEVTSSAGLLDLYENPQVQAQSGPEQRSTLAMEDLGMLMLRMGIGDEGEPSFTIATGNSNISNPAVRRTKRHSIAPVPDPNVDLRVLHDMKLRHHLIDCFCRYFNPFHQVFVPSDIPTLEVEHYTHWTPDEQMRNIAAFAVGAHFSTMHDARDIGQQCAEHAENMILRCLKHHPSELVVQGLSLLAWRDLSLGDDAMSWNFNCSATGLALRLGLHVTALSKLSEFSTFDALNIHNRRIRSFWVYFSIDRMVTSMLGMNCTMPWQRVRAAPFSSILGPGKSIDEIAFCRQGQLWHLWDSLMDQTFAFDWLSVTPLGKRDLLLRSQIALFAFYRESDPALSGSEPSAIYYQLAFQAAVILIHRPFFSEPTGTPTLPIALQAASNAALEICRIIRNVKNSSSLEDFPPHIVNYILCAAVIHLMNATCGKISLGKRSANNLRTCMIALGNMRRRWEFRQETAIRFIQEMAQRWSVVWALPMQFSAPLRRESEEFQKNDRAADIESRGEAIPNSDIFQSGQDEDILNLENFQEIAGYFESMAGVSELGWLFNEGS